MELPCDVVIKDSECSDNILLCFECRYKLWSSVVKYWDSPITRNRINVSLGDENSWYKFRIIAFVLFEHITASYTIEF